MEEKQIEYQENLDAKNKEMEEKQEEYQENLDA